MVAPLIVGYVFALKIQEESKIRTIGSIVVLSSFALMLSLMVWIANPLASPWVRRLWRTCIIRVVGQITIGPLNLAISVMLEVAAALVLGFIGLYVGSMLRTHKT